MLLRHGKPRLIQYLCIPRYPEIKKTPERLCVIIAAGSDRIIYKAVPPLSLVYSYLDMVMSVYSYIVSILVNIS